MNVILNYKSYFEAFRIGMSDQGYTAVARVLFSPLFEPGELLDEFDNPYGVTNQNARAWALGIEHIPQNIKKAITNRTTGAKWRKAIIDGFAFIYPDKVSSVTKKEMLESMRKLVDECDIERKTKDSLIKYYDRKQYAEFLARVFIRALQGNNRIKSGKEKIKASETNSAAVSEFERTVNYRRHRPQAIVPDEIQDQELKYVKELYAAYQDASGIEVRSREDLEVIHYRKHFENQRKFYYKAEAIHHELRDSVLPDEGDCFDEVKDEIEDGISYSLGRHYENGVEKIDAVTNEAAHVILSNNTTNNLYNWMGPGEKKGVCHFLVIDERIKWVGDCDE